MVLPQAVRSWIYAYMLLLWNILRQPRWLIEYKRIPAVPRVIFLFGGVIAKSTTCREYDAMVLVNSLGVDLPVPKVRDSVRLPRHLRRYFQCSNTGEDNESVLLIMTRLPGKPIGGQLNQYSDGQVTRLTEQLSIVFGTLRAISPSGNVVSGMGGRPCASYLISFDLFGPFDSVASFNEWMLQRAQSRINLKTISLPRRLDVVETRFAHGDLNPRNVLVDEDGNLTGLIDWENAGWMPRHWDLAYACCVYNEYKNWVKVIHGVFPNLEHDLQVEEQWKACWGA